MLRVRDLVLRRVPVAESAVFGFCLMSKEVVYSELTPVDFVSTYCVIWVSKFKFCRFWSSST